VGTAGVEAEMNRVRDRFARLDGLRIHFRHWDGPSDDAPVLVLLHGGMGDAHAWDLFGPVFASHYRVIAPDARGHGESDWSPANQYSPEHQAADLTHLLAALGCDEVSIVGASMGGWTGYSVAAQFPQLVKKLVIVERLSHSSAINASRSSAERRVISSRVSCIGPRPPSRQPDVLPAAELGAHNGLV
jgi:pimeloyl-ACP methyl ester carboxylesterase